MAGQQDTLREQWRIAIIGAGGVGLSILLVEKFIIDPIAPESVWVSIPVMATIITVGIAMARYWLIMGSYAAAAEGTREREAADGLRERLEQGGGAGKIYEKALTRFLNAVDRFFGDADPAVKTLWPRAFGYRGQAPFWTTPAYDRCLLIALLYPLLILLFVWTFTGEVGPGESALGFPTDLPWWRRLMLLSAIMIASVSLWIQMSYNEWRIKIATIFSFSFAFSIGFSSIDNFTILFIISYCGASVIGFYRQGGIAVLFSIIVIILNIILQYKHIQTVNIYYFYTYATLILMLLIVFIGFYGLHFHTENSKSHRLFIMIIFHIILIGICFGTPIYFADQPAWPSVGGMMLFIGLLTLVNAPFDWLTIGLTRALIRRGIELKRWWPILLASIDLILAAIVVMFLAITMLLAVQLFDTLAVNAGGTPILGVEKVLNDLADREMRTHPEYWWLYATLFSTLIPSIINVAIGALSIMRGSSGFHRYVAAKMPAGQAMLLADALWAVPLLALEVLGSVVIGVALTLGWIWAFVVYVLPWFGGLIPMLRAVAGLG